MAGQVRAADVADFILAKLGSMSAMKLQKLLYYSQAWALAWTETELFPEDFQAWANGPVLRGLYDQHKGFYRLDPGFFRANPGNLSEDQQVIVGSVLEYYGDKDPQWLSELTHLEDPWKAARQGVPDGDRSENIITKASMLEYYHGL